MGETMNIDIKATIQNPIIADDYNKAWSMHGKVTIKPFNYFFYGNGNTRQECIKNFVGKVSQLLPNEVHGRIHITNG